jgi:galactokinase
VIDPEQLARAFEADVGHSPRIYRAPGRVNLIGEHTDYNDGFVMPIALDRSTWVAAAPRDDGRLVVRSREYGETVTINLDDASCVVAQPFRAAPAVGRPEGLRYEGPAWAKYVVGVAETLEARRGADLMVASDVPIGAGLSSSAALEVACGYALMDLAGSSIDLNALARAAQRAEHQFVGTRCGIMDQMIACHGRAESALCLDTRSLECRWLPLPSRARLVVGNTMVRHALASSEYNARRADCEAGVAVLAQQHPSVRALRDVALDELEASAARLPERVYRRCRHVITENARVQQAAAALESSDFNEVGRLMNASHQSLRDDYDVSCNALDTMSAIARSFAGVYGARMTGGGFGGCVVALVDAAAESSVVREIARQYEASTGLRPEVWTTGAGRGVGVVEVGAGLRAKG